jgi:dGTPase
MFENDFYSETDCRFVHFDGVSVYLDKFVRSNWNSGNPHRSPFQRDLDRLVFSGPFRRLQGKTQVRRVGPRCFSRTRLSHSIEIARIARSLVKRLYHQQEQKPESYVDLDLVEFACYAHDIGNPPFGHAGETALNLCMKGYDGFEGNAQSLRIITEIARSECRDGEPIRKGIEPTQAAVESILKYRILHCEQTGPSEGRSKFLCDHQDKLIKGLSLSTSKSIECQIMDIADDIGNAFIDFTDGDREEIITSEAVQNECDKENNVSKPIRNKLLKFLKADNINAYANWLIGECVKSLHSQTDTPYARSGWEIGLGDDQPELIKTLKRINRSLVFKQSQIQANDNSGAFIIRVIFDSLASHYCEKRRDSLLGKIIPKDWDHRIQKSEAEQERLRLVADFISGMTDDYADMIFHKLIDAGSAKSSFPSSS